MTHPHPPACPDSDSSTRLCLSSFAPSNPGGSEHKASRGIRELRWLLSIDPPAHLIVSFRQAPSSPPRFCKRRRKSRGVGAPMGGAEEIHGASLERGEETPLLHKKNSSGRHDFAVKLAEHDGQFSLLHRSSDWRAPAIILGYKFLEGIGYCAVYANLVIYLSSMFHETNAASAANTSTWSGTTFFTPLLGAIVADAFLGRYRTVLISILLNLLGMITVTLSACLPSLRPPPCEGSMCPPATTAQDLALFCGLYLVAFGCGFAKSCLIPLGADQFYDQDPADRERRASFFRSFYLCIILGKLVASTVIVWIEDNVSWALGFGLGTVCVAIGVGAFLLGTPIFRLVKRPGGSPLTSVAPALVANSVRKMHLDVPNDDCNLLHTMKHKNLAGGTEQSARTDSSGFLDKASTVSDSDKSNNGHCRNHWRLCTVSQVEELKLLLHLLPIWISSVIYYAPFQFSITFIQQGNAMDRNIGSFSISPASLQAFEVVSVTCLSVVYDNILVPIAAKFTGNRRGLSLLQRIGVGHVFLTITMAVAAVLEAKRLESAMVGKLLSIAWQLPLYFVLACAEMLVSVGLLEFFYEQAPDTMKSLCASFFFLSLSLGSYLSSMIISFIMLLTARGGQPGWLPQDLNEGHLDYIFWVLSALSTLNFALYLIFANNYTLKRVAFESEEICS